MLSCVKVNISEAHYNGAEKSFKITRSKGRSGLCEFVYSDVTVGEFVHWGSPPLRSGMPSKEGSGPLNKLLSGGDTSTR